MSDKQKKYKAKLCTTEQDWREHFESKPVDQLIEGLDQGEVGTHDALVRDILHKKGYDDETIEKRAKRLHQIFKEKMRKEQEKREKRRLQEWPKKLEEIKHWKNKVHREGFIFAFVALACFFLFQSIPFVFLEGKIRLLVMIIIYVIWIILYLFFGMVKEQKVYEVDRELGISGDGLHKNGNFWNILEGIFVSITTFIFFAGFIFIFVAIISLFSNE